MTISMLITEVVEHAKENNQTSGNFSFGAYRLGVSRIKAKYSGTVPVNIVSHSPWIRSLLPSSPVYSERTLAYV